MVYLPLLEEMRELYRNNLQTYVKEHPREFLLLESGRDGIEVHFFKTKRQLYAATRKYDGLIGSTYFTEKIPLRTHRFNEGNKTLEFLTTYIECCPNDGLTQLVAEGPVTHTHREGVSVYEELAQCPDCRYQVFRRPTDETIRLVEKDMKRVIF